MVQIAAEPYPFNGTPEQVERWHQNRIAPNARWRVRTINGKVFWIERRILGLFWMAHRVVNNPAPYTSISSLVTFSSVDEAKAYIKESDERKRQKEAKTVYYIA